MSPADPSRIPAATATLPLFPLSTVLFPGGRLQLRIFETRYVDMVRRCMREESPFGVVLIRAGAEVGPIVEVAELGVTARIVDFSTLPDGLLGITCAGERKFRVTKRWQQPDGLHLGDIAYLPGEPGLDLPGEYRHLGELLGKLLAELGGPYAGLRGNLQDAAWVGCRLAEILPISLSDKIGLLELDEPLARLARLNLLVRRVGN